VDNPDTHLELTMIHEAMVLEYSGADLALVEWASALKELLFMTVLVNLFLPVGLASSAGALEVAMASALYLGKLFLLAVALTLVEVTNAKLRLFRVPELMAACFGLGFLALAIRFL
jgi:formate hydrogenlyase subunit 4